MSQVFIGIGSNVGDREKNIKEAIERIEKENKIVKKSSIYETEPVGLKDQPLFLNCIIEIKTEKSVLDLLDFLQSIEKNLGRERTIKNGPRTIDLDILFYDDRIIETENVEIPHPRLHERLFVLEPMNEIAPDFVHPKLKKSIQELMQVVFSK